MQQPQSSSSTRIHHPHSHQCSLPLCWGVVHHLTQYSSHSISCTQVNLRKILSWNISIYFNCIRYKTRPVMSTPGLYDPTAIMNSATLDKCQKEGWAKLAFYLLSFFYYIYGWDYKLYFIILNNQTEYLILQDDLFTDLLCLKIRSQILKN